jgi:VanZ family protein
MIYLPAVILTVGISVLSLTESTHMPSVSLNDKAIHGLFYTLLAMSWLVPTVKQGSKNSNFQTFKHCVVICVATTAYGALLELLQHYCTLTRSGEWLDVLADFLGALIGVLIVFVISKSRHHDISN